MSSIAQHRSSSRTRGVRSWIQGPALFVVAGTWTLGGCEDGVNPPVEIEHRGSVTQAVIGSPLSSASAEFDPFKSSVVRLFVHGPSECGFAEDRAGMCTATLVGQNKVLTAAHCLLGAVPGESWIMLGDSPNTVTDGQWPGSPEGRYYLESYELHPFWANATCIDNVAGPADVAVATLAEPLSASELSTGIHPDRVLVAPPSFGFQPIQADAALVGAGDPQLGIRQVGWTKVEYRPWSTELDSKRCYGDAGGSFDLLTLPDIGEAGDSGGIVLLHVGGALKVVGINSWQFGGGHPYHSAPTYSAANGAFLRRALLDDDSAQPPDSDCDGIVDGFDNCVDVWNFYQQDADSDALGDVCDNCPSVTNLDQRNCNVDAERARSAEVLGDACDPVPCPAFQGRYADWGPILGGSSGSNQYAVWTTVTVATDLQGVSVEPLGSFDLVGDALHRPIERPDHNVGTEYRYCVNMTSPQVIQCERDEYVDNFYLTNSLNRDDERASSVWHRIWIDELGPANWNDNPFEVWSRYFRHAGEPAKPRTWAWKDDFQKWLVDWGAGTSLVFPTTPTDTRGRFWIHAMTDTGETHDIGSGLHPVEPNDTDDHTRLASHYEALDPIDVHDVRTIHRATLKPPPLYAHFCPDCIIRFPNFADSCPMCGALDRILDHTGPYEAQILLGLGPHMNHEVGVLRHDGSVQIVTDKIGAALRATLASDVVWATAVEPSPNIGRGWRAPAAVALSPDGTEVRDVAYQHGRTLLGVHDRVDLFQTLSSGASVSSAAPSARTDFKAVYSRSTDRVFVVGGNDAGQPAHDIWWRGTGAGTWRPVPLASNYRPERVMAATFSYVDSRLWVLDERMQGNVPFARLVRIDPQTGHHELLGTWPRQRGWFQNQLFEDHWLVLDRDGSVLFVASSGKLGRHAAVRIALRDGESPHVEGIRLAKGKLAGAPVVDVDGYSFLIKAGNSKPPRIERMSDLPLWPGTWNNLGGCL